MTKILSGVALLFGIAVTNFLLSKLPNHYFRQSPGSNSEISINHAFATDSRPEQHFIVSNCTLIHDSVGTELTSNFAEIFHPTGNFSSLLNFSLRKSGNPDHQFYDFGQGGSTFADHLALTYLAVRAPNPKTIVYSNFYYEALNNPDRPGSALEAFYVADKISQEYPETKPFLAEFIDHIIETSQFKSELRYFGKDWDQHIDPKTLTLDRLYYWKEFLSLHRGLQERKFFFLGGLQQIRQFGSFLIRDEAFAFYLRSFFRPVFSASEYFLRSFTDENLLYLAKWDRHVEKNLNQNLRHYHDPNLNFPFNRIGWPWLGDFYFGHTGKLRLNFLKAMALISKAHSVRFFYYFPPLLSLDRDYFFKTFKPNHVDLVSKLEPQFRIQVIDRTLSHNLFPQDFHNRWNSGTIPKKTVSLMTSVGNLKRGLLLLNDLKGEGSLNLKTSIDGSKIWSGFEAVSRNSMPTRITD